MSALKELTLPLGKTAKHISNHCKAGVGPEKVTPGQDFESWSGKVRGAVKGNDQARSGKRVRVCYRDMQPCAIESCNIDVAEQGRDPRGWAGWSYELLSLRFKFGKEGGEGRAPKDQLRTYPRLGLQTSNEVRPRSIISGQGGPYKGCLHSHSGSPPSRQAQI